MRTELATSDDRHEWDEFVSASEQSHMAHLWAWHEIIARSFSHRPFFGVARQSLRTGSRLVGVLPLFEVRSFLFGRSLVSVPYLNGGGIVAQTSEATQALARFATDLAKGRGAKYIELRHRRACTDLESSLVSRSHKVALELRPGIDPRPLLRSFKSSFRRKILIPEKRGYRAKTMLLSEADGKVLRRLYAVFSRHMRDLGTPVYPRALFEHCAAHLGKRARLVLIRKNEQLVSACVLIAHKHTMEMPWAVSLKEHHRDFPNMLLYWNAIETCIDTRHEVLDFGRSTIGSGQHKFKQSWGAKDVPLHWYYALRTGQALPSVDPKNPRFSPMVDIWKKLPLPVANAMGPAISRSLP